MIELILTERCAADCLACVDVCPTAVFEAGPDDRPVIARPDACQTCLLCELYCPQDALYVGPDRDRGDPEAARLAVAAGLAGELRRDSGWDEWAEDPRYASQYWRMDELLFHPAGNPSVAQDGRPIQAPPRA